MTCKIYASRFNNMQMIGAQYETILIIGKLVRFMSR
jgi:hypothetical protein